MSKCTGLSSGEIQGPPEAAVASRAPWSRAGNIRPSSQVATTEHPIWSASTIARAPARTAQIEYLFVSRGSREILPVSGGSSAVVLGVVPEFPAVTESGSRAGTVPGRGATRTQLNQPVPVGGDTLRQESRDLIAELRR
jgi:hypothetical protein